MPIQKRVNEQFFDSWSPESAYLLGLLYSDGTITTNPRGSQYIEFVSTDKELIYNFRFFLGSNHKIALKRHATGNWKSAYRIQIGNKHLISRLSGIGLRRKSILPYLPREFFRHYVRGFFDGDGCVVFSSFYRKKRNKKEHYLQVVLTSKYQKFLRQLYRGLRKRAGLQGGSLYEYSRAQRLRYSQRDTLKLFVFLYKDVKMRLRLMRKYRIFKKAGIHFGLLGT